jgi:DNA polymerase III delta prime subunit
MELQIIQNKIIEIRGHKVMLDFHLAELYEVETRALKQAVKRNMERFPEDFMFILTKDEWKEVITNCDNLPSTIKFSPAVPFAFTEQGVAMLSSVLKSKKAIAVNISIMRAFALLRQYLSDYKNLKQSIEALEKEMNLKFKDIYEALNFLLSPKSERKPIGYKQNKK